MIFSLTNNMQTNLYEAAEVSSALFCKNNYKASINIYMNAWSQKEYTKATELLFFIFYFYVFKLQPSKFETAILSTGFSRKEQVHRSTLNILKFAKQSFTLFDSRLQNFLFLLNMIYVNFYKTNSKYFVKKYRFLKNSRTIFFTKTRNITTHSINRGNKLRISYMQFLINFSGFFNKHNFSF